MVYYRVTCKVCDAYLASDEQLCFFQPPSNGTHLIVKIEKSESVLNKQLVATKPPADAKRNKFTPQILVCAACQLKVGSCSLIGPKQEAVCCLKAESIQVRHSNGQVTSFDHKNKWSEQMHHLPHIETRTFHNFYGGVEGHSCVPPRSEFAPTRFIDNNTNESTAFNIGDETLDVPRTYQLELYLSGLRANSVFFLPTGAGKTMCAAMLAIHMRRLNPHKRIFFVCDRIPLVFQQAAYVRSQCCGALRVGEFCSENKQVYTSQIECDVLVFTCDLLLNLLAINKLYLQDCSLLVIDEIHHAANENHSFARLIRNHYRAIDDASLRPRLIGLTASPAAASTELLMQTQIASLCSLIDGHICMPHVFKSHLDAVVNRPELNFYGAVSVVSDSGAADRLVTLINSFAEPFLVKLNATLSAKNVTTLHNNTAVRGFVNNLLRETNVHADVARFNQASLVAKLYNALEILNVLGADECVAFLANYLTTQANNNAKNRTWTSAEMQHMHAFAQNIAGCARGKSSKFMTLLQILRADTKR